MLSLLLPFALITTSVGSSQGEPATSLAPRGGGYLRSSVRSVAGHNALRRLKRQKSVGLSNRDDGTMYTIDLSIGTPGQPVTVIIDTGSSDLWVNPSCETSGQASFCSSLPKFDYTASSTLQDTGAADILSYGKGNVTLEYVTDMVSIGSAQIQDQVFGVGLESYDIPVGILGLSPPTSDAQTQYSFVLDSMADQGLIESRAFSLDLRNVDDPNGSVIFGGIDTGKFIGSLEKCPILDAAETPSGADRYWITMTGVGITLPDGESQSSDAIEVPVFLDSGGTLSRLPTPIYQAIGDSFPGAQLDQSSGFYYVDCDVGQQPGSVDFTFNNKKIAVPYADFIWEADAGQCVVGLLPNDDEPVLGDSFLRAAYVVYDQDNRNLHLAQAANCGSNLVEIGSGSDAVPSVTGDCTGAAEQVSATRTFDATRTRAPTNVGSSKVAGATDVGPGPAETKVSVTGGLGTAKPTVGKTTGGASTSASPSPTNNAAAPGVPLYAGAFGAVGVMHMVAMAM